MDQVQKPKPLITTEADRTFWEAVNDRKLMITKCRNCGLHSHPRVNCLCGDPDLTWVEAAGTGRVYTFIVYHRPYHPAFANEVPYNVSWIELDEGPLLMSNVIGCENADIRVGLPVEVVFKEEKNGVILPKFEPIPAD